MAHRYTFGDTDLAGQRLALLAEAYAPTSWRFLADAVSAIEAVDGIGAIDVCVDIGCGPGHTTRLAHEACRARETIGLDASEKFVELATRLHSDEPEIRFLEHDAMVAPFPCSRADLVYCRFLLTHLTDPLAALRVWGEALSDTGHLLLQEVVRLRSDHEVLDRYYEIVAAMQAANAQDMHIGDRLDELAVEAGLSVSSFDVVDPGVDPRAMARLHHLNIQTWRSNSFVQENYGSHELDELDLGLLGVMDLDDTDAAKVHLDSGLSQLVCTR